MDSSAGVTVCAFVEKPFTHTDNVEYDRSSNWHVLLLERGFAASEATFGWDCCGSSTWWTSYCKPLMPEVTYEITELKQTYVFPTTDSTSREDEGGGFVHGLCVLGAESATASSSDLGFTYTPLTVPSGFATATQLWTNRGYRSVGVDGGGAALCEGGLYLQPSGVFVSFIYYHILCTF